MDGVNIFGKYRLNGCSFLDGFGCVGLLTAKPIDNGYKSENDAYPIESVRDRINHMLECPLEAVGYRLKDALEVHG
jgi:hypothetical protein